MLAARLYGPRDIRIDQISEPPPPGPGQVRVKVTAVGICGSDLHTYPRAIRLAATRPAHLRLEDLVSHHFPLRQTAHAFAMNAGYAEGVHKIMIDVTPA